jgi:hypothetical protein
MSEQYSDFVSNILKMNNLLTSDVWFVRPQQKQYIIFFREYVLQCSVVLSTFLSSVYTSTHIYFLFMPFSAVCIGKFILVEIWETTCYWLCDFFDLAALVYTMSKNTGTLKWATHHDPNFA